MDTTDVYKTAIAALYEKTYGRFEHNEDKAIELFDKLLDAGMLSHCDAVKKLCRDAGYCEHAAQSIADIYDILSLYKRYQKKGPMYWDIEELLGR